MQVVVDEGNMYVAIGFWAPSTLSCYHPPFYSSRFSVVKSHGQTISSHFHSLPKVSYPTAICSTKNATPCIPYYTTGMLSTFWIIAFLKEHRRCILVNTTWVCGSLNCVMWIFLLLSVWVARPAKRPSSIAQLPTEPKWGRYIPEPTIPRVSYPATSHYPSAYSNATTATHLSEPVPPPIQTNMDSNYHHGNQYYSSGHSDTSDGYYYNAYQQQPMTATTTSSNKYYYEDDGYRDSSAVDNYCYYPHYR